MESSRTRTFQNIPKKNIIDKKSCVVLDDKFHRKSIVFQWIWLCLSSQSFKTNVLGAILCPGGSPRIRIWSGALGGLPWGHPISADFLIFCAYGYMFVAQTQKPMSLANTPYPDPDPDPDPAPRPPDNQTQTDTKTITFLRLTPCSP